MPPSGRLSALILSTLLPLSVLHAAPASPSPDVSVVATGGEADENCQFLVAFSGVVKDDCGVRVGDVQVAAIPVTGKFKVGPVLFNAVPAGAGRLSVSGTVLVSDVVDSPARLAIRLSGADACGLVATNATEVTIADTLPPSIAVSLDPGQLWPVNHRLQKVGAEVRVVDNCPNAAFTLTGVTSSEAKAGAREARNARDIQGASLGTPDLSFRLRAERSGAARIYTITYTATDASRNSSMAAGFVAVPLRWSPGMAGGGKSRTGFPDRSGSARCETRLRGGKCRGDGEENQETSSRRVGKSGSAGSVVAGG